MSFSLFSSTDLTKSVHVMICMVVTVSCHLEPKLTHLRVLILLVLEGYALSFDHHCLPCFYVGS